MTIKISAVIPHWPMLPEHDDLLKKCVRSLDADEVIVVVNEGTGMGKAINKGIELSSGDFIVVSNNDCQMTMGSLQDMCDEEAITLPDNMPGQLDLPRAFFCMPRWIYEKIGGYDEQFEVGYWEDNDIIRRWQDAGVPFKMTKVQVAHDPGSTLNKMENRDEVFRRNKELYLRKWGTV